MTTQTAEYALRAVVCLAARGGERMTTAELASLTHVPAGYLSKVLQALARAGLVTGQRGQGGGFVLAVPPETLTVLRVLNAVEPSHRLHACPLDCDGRGTVLCALHEQMDLAAAEVERVFSSVTVAALLARPYDDSPLCTLAPDC